MKCFDTLGVIAVVMIVIAFFYKPSSVYNYLPEEKNPMEGKKVALVKNQTDNKNADGERGHLEVIGTIKNKVCVYCYVWKRLLDIFISFCRYDHIGKL